MTLCHMFMSPKITVKLQWDKKSKTCLEYPFGDIGETCLDLASHDMAMRIKSYKVYVRKEK